MKRKQKTKHLEITYSPQAAKISRGNLNLYKDVLQQKQKAPTPASDQKAGDAASSSSHYFSCISSEDKLNGAGIEAFHKCAPQPEYSLEDKTLVHKAKDIASESEYYTCHSTLSMPTRAEFRKSQADAPGTRIVVPTCSQAAGQSSSTSAYFSCVSSPSKHILVENDGIHQLQQDPPCLQSSEMPPPQDLEEQETLSPYHHICFHFHLANEPCTPETHRRKERDMKVYYMRVQRKRGVAVLQDTEEESEPPTKRARVEEITFPGKLPTDDNLSYVSTWELLTESESSLDVEAQDGGDEAVSPAEPHALQEQPRARTPEWLVAPENGFKCMGCCRVFPSLEVLQGHVQHGVEEGFSCLAFHLAFAWLKSKRNTKDMPEKRRKKKIRKAPSECSQEKGTGKTSKRMNVSPSLNNNCGKSP
uniref:Family with sequence similarity 170 member A n=1 Tax=Oryctolagus cuniculus TaxID=9986 RepID=A0A5F9CWT8_RABIT